MPRSLILHDDMRATGKIAITRFYSSGASHVLRRLACPPEMSMGGEMILLRVIDDAREGWNFMPLEEFLERINLGSWKDGQELVGVILPLTRQITLPWQGGH